MRKFYLPFVGLTFAAIWFTGCAQNKPAGSTDASTENTETLNIQAYEDLVDRGKHLVAIGGCGDCHTPKKMTPNGPVDDSSLLLSGHPQNLPAPDIDRKEMESKGLVVTATFTSWVGPWGISYSANLTPDETGLGNWTEERFLHALRNNVSKGVVGGRPLMPPMSMMPVKEMTDEELKAIFAYLKTIKPVKNSSVQPTPPVLTPKQ